MILNHPSIFAGHRIRDQQGCVRDAEDGEKNSKAKDVFDMVKTDVRLYKQELNAIERNHGPKERFLGQLKASPESMQTSKEGLESELIQAGHFIHAFERYFVSLGSPEGEIGI